VEEIKNTEPNKPPTVDKKGFAIFKPIPTIKEHFDVFNSESEFIDVENNKEYTKNQDIKIIRCGYLTKFDSYLKKYISFTSNFTVISYGLTKKIIYGRNHYVFFGVKGQKRPSGIHLVGLVKKDVDDYIARTGHTLKIPKKLPYTVYVHKNNIAMYDTGVQALAIDINHCYWRTAYILGYITELTYMKGLEKDEYKDGRLIAIGNLGKIIGVTMYENGVKVLENADSSDYIKYGGFYWSIINKMETLMLELIQSLRHDFLMFLTDCIVIPPDKKEQATAIIEKHGYQVKEYSLFFTEITEEKVSWETDKGEKKQIIHNQMLKKYTKKINTKD